MTGSLWELTGEELLSRASSGAPSPGGGAIAAVAAALGLSLVQMAIEVTLAAPGDATASPDQLNEARHQARELQARLTEAADRDVAEFDALMAGYRLPRETDAERAARQRAIDDATVAATRGPLSLAESAGVASQLADRLEPLVKTTIVSDVQAGRDLLRGAALAAVRTADINLAALEARGHPESAAVRQRRDAVAAANTVSEA